LKVAVIGAGLTGVLVALNLVERSCNVTLFERSNELMGYVYAMDSSLHTAHAMLRRAEAFRREGSRWTATALFERHILKPFIYAAPLDSMKNLECIQDYFDAVSDLENSYSVAPGGRRPLHTSRLSQAELSNLFDASKVSAAWQTEEVAIDPLAVRLALIDALSGLSRIEIRLGCEVQKVGDPKRS
jgi:glycine/D-amino acid oxidase-like deaminating enzyme